ncbi:dehydrogenase/reductase SDR family member 12 isoform X5 [Chamaea fasciata]|uniref:dehydrogenase/reductase SDR family member 12 isoform X5 n=1 Tax=Chamaea fasciata TaxID=190680 RepID=UPI00336A23A8
MDLLCKMLLHVAQCHFSRFSGSIHLTAFQGIRCRPRSCITAPRSQNTTPCLQSRLSWQQHLPQAGALGNSPSFICSHLRQAQPSAARGGYESASKHFNPADVEVDVAGRSFLVTGANSGIGKATAKEIARRGGTVHLVCRNKERAEVAKEEIVSETGNQNIFLHIVDISNPKEIWNFAEKFRNEHKLNVLINNAGCMVNTRELTEDGLEKNFATNTLGTYIMTTALVPLLEKAADARVITVSSGGMLVQKLNISDLQSGNGPFDGTMVYAQNKRQQVVLTEQWAKAHRNIHFSVMHPGWADTPAVRSSMPDFYERMKNSLRTEAQGADTVLWLAVSAEATKLPSGLFFQDRQPVPTHLPLAYTHSPPEDEEKLMEVLEEFSQKFKSVAPRM